jgi:endonuclease YncB( thermonuclease family)
MTQSGGLLGRLSSWPIPQHLVVDKGGESVELVMRRDLTHQNRGNTMKTKLGVMNLASVLVLLTTTACANAQEPAGALNLQGLSVVSGDTLMLDSETIRINGVRTPAVDAAGQCLSAEKLGALAVQFAQSAIAGAIVQIDREGEADGMTTATVYINEEELAAKIIAAGLGVASKDAPSDWCAVKR